MPVEFFIFTFALWPYVTLIFILKGLVYQNVLKWAIRGEGSLNFTHRMQTRVSLFWTPFEVLPYQNRREKIRARGKQKQKWKNNIRFFSGLYGKLRFCSRRPEKRSDDEKSRPWKSPGPGDSPFPVPSRQACLSHGSTVAKFSILLTLTSPSLKYSME